MEVFSAMGAEREVSGFPAVRHETFGSVFCLSRSIDDLEFERKFFLEGVPFPVRLIAALLLRVVPGWFQFEMQCLAGLKAARNRNDFVSELWAITDFNRYQLPWWRGYFGLRISTRRLMRIRTLLLEAQHQSSMA